MQENRHQIFYFFCFNFLIILLTLFIASFISFSNKLFSPIIFSKTKIFQVNTLNLSLVLNQQKKINVRVFTEQEWYYR